jgi:ribosomal protein L35AE/L33A
MDRFIKSKIEELAGVDFRFQLLATVTNIEKVMNYFNIKEDNLNSDNALEIVKFFNKSNTKLHDSYWVIRTNELDFKKKKQEYINTFVCSSYKHTTRRNIANKFNQEHHGRGYSGWVTIHNNQYYVRSKFEFIFIHYLLNEIYDSSYEINMEDQTFYYNNMSYRPDIFVYKDNKLIKIFEIKYSTKAKNGVEKARVFDEYFKSLNIDFEIIFNQENIIAQYPYILVLFDEWKKTNKQPLNLSGEYNPMYGRKQSEKTKELIRQKCIERNLNPKYKEKCKKTHSHRKWTEENYEQRRIRTEKARIQKNIDDPFETRKCDWCGVEFTCRRSSKKVCCCGSHRLKYRLKYENLIRSTASKESLQNQYKCRILSYAKLIKQKYSKEQLDIGLYDYTVKILKNNGSIPAKFGMYSHVVINYFETFDKFKTILYESSDKNTVD